MNRKKKCENIAITDIKNESAINIDMDIAELIENDAIIDIKNKIPINIDLDIENDAENLITDLENEISINDDLNIKAKKCPKSKTHFCKYCKIGFSNKSNMVRHIKFYCRTKKKNEEKIIKLEKLLNKLKGNKEEQKTPTIINNNITNNNTVNNNNIVNIQINKYGKETIDYITPAFIRKIKTDSSLNGLLRLANHIYCNSKHMDNCTVVVIDISHDRCKINGKEYWETKSLKDVVEDNLVRTSCKMSDVVENAAADQGRERDEQGFPILDEFEKRLIECYNHLNDEDYAKQVKEINRKHKDVLIDHCERNKIYFDKLIA